MKAKRFIGRRKALTLIEVMMALAILAAVVAVVLPMLARSKSGSTRMNCRNNLIQVGLSSRIWANDHNDLYPMQVPGAKGGAREAVERGEVFRIFLVMSNELSIPRTLLCPSDTRTAATNWNAFGNTNTSYFVGLDAVDTQPNMLLSGDRNLALNGRLLTGAVGLGTNSPVAWTGDLHKNAGNIGLADGSVQQVTGGLLQQQLISSGDATNRILFPQ
jgi:prepilin-type N-terminal cleavage/methylation domain-containing protein/prepilin-type processing-associated H-X9-DG protein